MSCENIKFFNDTIDFIVKFIKANAKNVCRKQSQYADIFNKLGIKLFYKKELPVAKACFWISDMLGNPHAYKNFLCI